MVKDITGKADVLKILVVGMLSMLCLGIAHYFQFVLKTDSLYTHLFYIPIVLASMWWGWTGMSVPVLFAAQLVLMHITSGLKAPVTNDMVRAVMFIAVGGVVAALSEIKERANAEIHESEEKYRGVVEVSLDGIEMVDRDGNFTFVSDRFCEMHGYEREELIGKPLTTVVPPEDREEWTKSYRKAMKEAVPPELTNVKHVRKDGTTFDAQISWNYIRDGSEVVGSAGIGRDVTEYRKMEDELRESETNYRTLVEGSGQAISTVSRDGIFHFMNGFAASQLGGNPEDFIGKTMWEIFPKDVADVRMSSVIKVIQSGEPLVIESRSVIRGEEHWYETRLNPLKNHSGKIDSALVVAADITERKKTEEALRESESKWRSLVENTTDIIMIVDRDGIIQFINKVLVGMEVKDVIGKRQYEYIQPEYRQVVEETVGEVFKTGEQGTYEVSGVGPGGSIAWYTTTVGPIKSGGEVYAVIVTARDITERKKMEDELRESEEKYRGVVEVSLDGIDVVDREGNFTFVSNSFCEMHGYEKEELIGRPLTTVVPPEDREGWTKAFRKAMKEAVLPELTNVKHVRKDGTTFDAQISWNYLRDGSEVVGSVGMLRDVTEYKLAEDKIKASLKEKEVLLQEIHHRVKNNLQVVSGLLKLQARYVSDERDAVMFEESQNRIRSMALVHEKLYQSKDLASIDFGEYIGSIAGALLKMSSADPNAVVLKIDVGEVFLDIDNAAPCGLIINELVTNSLKHAFPNGRKGEIRVGINQKDGKVFLTVSDNGIGFPEEIDFKTAETLGLGLVNTLAEQLGGTIELDRSEGTKFEIKFSLEGPLREGN